MAGTGSSSPYIKDEPRDQFFSSHNERYLEDAQEGFNMSQPHFNQFGQHDGNIDPNDLTMRNHVAMPNGVGYGLSAPGSNYLNQTSNSDRSFSKGISEIRDDELLDSLGSMGDSHYNHQNGQNGQDFALDFSYPTSTYAEHNGAAALSLDPNQVSGYSNTPEGDPMQSPFVHNFNHAQFRHMQPHSMGVSLHSRSSYPGSPMTASEGHPGDGSVFPKQRPRLSGVMQGRRSSNPKSPLTPKTPGISSLNIGPSEHKNFPAQPIRTNQARHQKTLSGQWDQTPSSHASYPGSDFGSPIQGLHPNAQISDVLKGASMPAKLSNGHLAGGAPALQSQEMKRRRRRESHNLVERRRRDNINERIQELSHLVPQHRLEDEKVRKALQNNSPLSPTLAGLSVPPGGVSPPQATSSLAGPGARRATAGTITTGIPMEEKDKGPNKGDILNGAVSWTRDLMWMLHTKLQQQEELANIINDLGGEFPFEQTENERRMQTELGEAMQKNNPSSFEYSRYPGSGLRVPKHTNLKGDPVGASLHGRFEDCLSPDNHSTGDAGQASLGGQYWSGHNSGDSGAGSISFKEEDEYGMDLTH